MSIFVTDRLCVVLITKKESVHDTHRDGFRKYAQRSTVGGYGRRVQFTYIYEDTQQDFVKALSKGKQMKQDTEQLMVIAGLAYYTEMLKSFICGIAKKVTRFVEIHSFWNLAEN